MTPCSFGQNTRGFKRQFLTLCNVHSILKTKSTVFSETWMKSARPRIPEDGNQLPSSLTALVSLLSEVVIASVWWKLVVTWVISARLLYRRRRGRLFSPLSLYSLSSLVLCIRRLEIRPGPDLSHFRWYWSNKRSCDNRFVSQIASFTLCSRPPKACGVTERAMCSSRRESCSGRVVGTVTLGPEAHPSSYSVGTRSLLLGLKRTARESDLPSPAGASTWRNTPKLHYTLILWSLNDSWVKDR